MYWALCFAGVFVFSSILSVEGVLDTCKLVNGRFNNHFGEFIAHTHADETYSCRALLGGTGDAHYSYRYTSLGDYVIVGTAASITKANLDQGDDTTAVSSLYAMKLNKDYDNSAAGTVITSALGGRGSDPVNVFPQSVAVQEKYKLFQDRIHHCLAVSDHTVSALLRVEFSYLTTTDTRPHGLYATVTFQGNSKCRSTSTTFDN